MFRAVLIVLLFAFASAFFGFPKPAGKAVPAPSKKAPAAPAKGKSAAPPKNMTWGGRPDPTPELYVDETATAVLPGWKFNLFGKKK